MQRTRSEHAIHQPGTHVDWNANGTPGSGYYPFPHAYERTTTDYVTPNFRSKQQRGELINNQFSTKATWRSYQGSYRNEIWQQSGSEWSMLQQRVYDHGICSWVLQNAPSVPLDNLNHLFGVSGNKALASVNSTSFNGPLFAAEWAKTRALVPQIGELLVKTFFRRGRGSLKGDLLATSKNLANAWLLGRFGVTPLLYELQGACELLTKFKPPRATARGNATDSIEASLDFSIDDAPGTWHFTRTKKFEMTARSGILYEGSDLNAGLLAQIGVTRPATVAWELIPWSFVLDRFVDIGTWLDAIQPDGASQYLLAWQGAKTVTHDRIEYRGFTPNESFGTRCRNAYMTCSINILTEEKVRAPWNPTAAMPVWNPTFNLKHLGDYAALVRQRIRSGSA